MIGGRGILPVACDLITTVATPLGGMPPPGRVLPGYFPVQDGQVGLLLSLDNANPAAHANACAMSANEVLNSVPCRLHNGPRRPDLTAPSIVLQTA